MGLSRRRNKSRHTLVVGLLLLAVGLLGCERGSQTTSDQPDTTQARVNAKAPVNDIQTVVRKTPAPVPVTPNETPVTTLPKPKPVSPPATPEPTPTTPAQTPPPSTAQTVVRVLGTLSAVRDEVAFFIVDRVIEGPFDCVQTTVVGANPEWVEHAQYQIEGSYKADESSCQLRLLDPLNGLIRLALPPHAVVPEAPVNVPPKRVGGRPFFASAGVSYFDPLPIFSGSAGLRFSQRLRGIVTAGFGSTTVEVALPSGEPIKLDVEVTLVKLSGLLSVKGPFYAGLSGGLLLLSGRYDLPYPVAGSTKFNTSIPLLGVVVGYDLGAFMVTLGAEIALGGKR